jgi:hypothetical protein
MLESSCKHYAAHKSVDKLTCSCRDPCIVVEIDHKGRENVVLEFRKSGKEAEGRKSAFRWRGRFAAAIILAELRGKDDANRFASVRAPIAWCSTLRGDCKSKT